MAVRTDHGTNAGLFFCTFTCTDWMPLFHDLDMYDWIYSWFDRLDSEDLRMTAFVIMPNHLHLLVFCPQGTSINHVLREGKRFMAYEIVKRAKKAKQNEILQRMAWAVNPTEFKNGSKHKVFKTSSDIKRIESQKFIDQKLNYIHANPCKGNRVLARQPEDYAHSSAAFYISGHDHRAPLIHVDELMGRETE